MIFLLWVSSCDFDNIEDPIVLLLVNYVRYILICFLYSLFFGISLLIWLANHIVVKNQSLEHAYLLG